MRPDIGNDGEPWSFTNSLANESASDTLDKKLYQAAGLASILVGEGREAFATYNDTIQEAVLWLIRDTIVEAMALSERVQEERLHQRRARS